jgi:hypothetical protein
VYILSQYAMGMGSPKPKYETRNMQSVGLISYRVQQ